jgi:putative aldouronate transport system permease protein
LSRSNKIKLSRSNILFNLVNNLFLLLCVLTVAVPLVNVLSQSLSSPAAVLNGKVTLIPVDFTVKSYGYVFHNNSIMTGYANSILYTAVGTAIAVAMTILAAYPLTRKKLHGQKFFLFLFTFTMLFGGGMIPTYLVVKGMGMIDTMWALIIPNAISVYNMIIARTFFMNTIPNELYEAAEIDGANEFTVFFRIVIPLSSSILAVLTLFYAVGLWNMYFDALIYINTASKYPLQLVLRSIMTSARVQSQMVQATGAVQSTEMLALTESLKYTTIVCASLPVLALYPFIQKHFTRGVMIGTLKG